MVLITYSASGGVRASGLYVPDKSVCRYLYSCYALRPSSVIDPAEKTTIMIKYVLRSG